MIANNQNKNTFKKYSAKYALTDVLVCGCCGSHYRRTGKNVKGEVQHVWRCLGRIEHRCKEAVGLEEKKLHSAICRCLSDMMDSREEVINLCRTNLQYALTGDTKVLDAYAIENQIRTHQDEINLLIEKEETTQGDPEDTKRLLSAYMKKSESFVSNCVWRKSKLQQTKASNLKSKGL